MLVGYKGKVKIVQTLHTSAVSLPLRTTESTEQSLRRVERENLTQQLMSFYILRNAIVTPTILGRVGRGRKCTG